MSGFRVEKIAERFDEEIRFFKSWVESPKAMGTMFPTGQVIASRMAGVINTGSGLPVLELGPGTGAITKAILRHGVEPQNVYSVEYTASLIPPLETEFPGVSFIHGDAFDLQTTLGDKASMTFDSVVSALPLLNFPVKQRIALVKDLLGRIPAGRPIVQLSYGPNSPVPPDWETYTVEPLDWIFRNLPPARLWIYRRIAKT
ncbi:phospholipid N-methyltransferase PmtA [Salaquimonas pukyongi]|uniref:phospholipid N-methyltransferase PmtA n=1 Tax=Salaquimonas pukyongi TaxID=2712698 RepID=UPI00096BA391|nr:methyltransferase domain-containing protein [Salaquimonas pukyongi]